MNWMMSETITVLGVLILSSMTGTAILTIWYLASRFFVGKGYFHFLYRLLRLIPVCFLFPLTTLLLRLPYFESRFKYSYLFCPTPAIYAIAVKAIAIWMAGAACIMGSYLYTAIKQHFHWRRRMPCSSHVMQLYTQACSKVGGQQFPRLYQSYGVRVPALVGVIRPVIHTTYQKTCHES